MEAVTILAAETAQPQDPKTQLPRHLQRAVDEGMPMEQALACITPPCGFTTHPRVVTTRPATTLKELPIHLRTLVEAGIMEIGQALSFAVVRE
ncbi:MAG: hypothetical protein AAB953_00150 [Patescibacteria group bacterium]